MARPKKIYDLKEVENAAAAAGTRTEFARLIGMFPSHFAHNYKTDPAFAAAFNRGVSTRSDGGTSHPSRALRLNIEIKSAAAEEPGLIDTMLAAKRERLAKVTAKDFHSYGVQQLSFKNIADELGTNSIGISQLCKQRPELRKAYERGRQGIDLGRDDGAAGALQQLAGTSPEDLEKKQLRDALEKHVRLVLARGPRTLPAIAEAVHEDRRKVFIVLSDLIAASEIVRDSSRELSTYRLKTEAEKKAPKPAPVTESRRPRYYHQRLGIQD